MVHGNIMTNCPINAEDIINAYRIFGQNLANARAKTVRWKPYKVEINYMSILKIFINYTNTLIWQ